MDPKIIEKIIDFFPVIDGSIEIKVKKYSIWKIKVGSNLYFLDFKDPILIDCGNRQDRNIITTYLAKLIPLDKIKKVIFTHLHYDHIGNFDMFPNAKFYASKQEIEDFRKSSQDTVLREDIVKMFNVDLIELESLPGLKVIQTPGHTRGSVCLWNEQEKILFSGDTIFNNNTFGRTDLPTSSSEDMHKTIMKLSEYSYKILCPGHDY